MPPDERTGNETPPALDRELVERLVGEVTESNKSVAAALAAQRSAGDPQPTFEQKVVAHQAKKAEIIEKRAALLADGKYAEADTLLLDWAQSAPQPDAAAQANAPAMVALKEAAIDRARRADKEVFEDYGEEVEAEIARLDPAAQITTSGIRKAVAAVKQAHFDEIMAKRVAESEEKIREGLTTQAPQNRPQPHLGETDDTDLHGLDADEREAARLVGVSYADMAAQKKLAAKPHTDDTYDILGPDLPAEGAF